jgi:PPK2 family polyphosphate:nucleotide phosphotransferase
MKGIRVEPGSQVDLADYDPGERPDWATKERLEQDVEKLAGFQERLAAQDTFALLVVLQGIDASGKDGTIRHVMRGANPQGVTVHSFKVPSAEELDHDYLWRYAQHVPRRGDIGIFNRSHYEEVLVVRVHSELLARQQLPHIGGGIWKRRFREINDWERYLTDNGIRIVKVFLNLSKDEQRKRFLARIDDPAKNWKIDAADVGERAHWDEYQHAFSEMLSHTSTEWAPWHVVPADHKKVARAVVGAVIVDALEEIDPQFPQVDPGELERVRDALAE